MALKEGDCESAPTSNTCLNYVRYPDTFVNLAFALLPTEVTAARHTTMIRAIMTAYSTAVGPSSDTMKFLTLFTILLIWKFLHDVPVSGRVTSQWLSATTKITLPRRVNLSTILPTATLSLQFSSRYSLADNQT